MAMIALTAVVVAGGVAGAAIDRVVLRSRGFALVLPDTGFHPLSTILRSPTDEERRDLRRNLADELGLTSVQARAVDSILDAHTAEFRQLREEIRPRVEQLTSVVRADVERVLTAEQRTRYRRLLGEQADARRDSTRTPK
jgi:hypothetical protein